MELETIRKKAKGKFKKLSKADKLNYMQKRIDFHKVGIKQNCKTIAGLHERNGKLQRNIEDIEMLLISQDDSKFIYYFM